MMTDPSNDILILCPYCLSPVREDTIHCIYCLQDTTLDAKHEMTRAEYEAEPKKACRHCGVELLSLAVFCLRCRQWQS
jgi:hypothetical protein